MSSRRRALSRAHIRPWPRTGVPAEQQRLVCHGKPLYGQRLLGEQSVDGASTVELMLRLQGGAPKKGKDKKGKDKKGKDKGKVCAAAQQPPAQRRPARRLGGIGVG